MKHIILRQTLCEAVGGYWDGGAKQVFDWKIERGHRGKDKRGRFVRVGSRDANFWFYVALGKTDKLTLSYAKKHLAHITRVPSTFEYIEGEA